MADEIRRNKNLWRKVVGYGSQPRPVSATFFDTESSTSIAYNLQEITRHRDYFEIKKDILNLSFGATKFKLLGHLAYIHII